MKDLISILKKKGVLNNPLVESAFKNVNREIFMKFGDPSEDKPFPIGEGQTISQPYTVAFMLDKLELDRGLKVLDVGCGSGYTTALLADIVGEKGSVIGVERHKKLVNFALANLSHTMYKNFEIKKAGEKLGYPEKALYDRILVSAAAKNEIPQILKDQLTPEGILVCPVDNSIQKYKNESTEIFKGFRFVPLIY